MNWRISIFLFISILCVLTTRLAAKADCEDGQSLAFFVFNVAFHLAAKDESQSRETIRAKLDAANSKFAAAGIAFRAADPKVLPQSFQVMETIRERHKVKPFLVPHAINVFAVEEIHDPTPSRATRKAAAAQGRKPSGRLAGAHIRAPKKKPATYILTVFNSRTDTLAHELGHFFGLPHHKDPENIMSYGANRSGFNAHQLGVMRNKARKYRRRNLVQHVRECRPRYSEMAFVK